MKKLLFVFAIACTLAACNNSSDGAATGDSVNNTTGSDTSNPNIITGDTVNMGGDSSRLTGDTSNRTGDTSNKR